MKAVGFIGAGNMGSAIMKGILRGGFSASDIYVCEKNPGSELESNGVNICSLEDTVKKADYIIIAVKPINVDAVFKDIAAADGYKEKTYISIAAGVKINRIESVIPGAAVIRVMPNLCLTAGEGMSVLCSNGLCSDADFEFADGIFSCSGKTAHVKEELIDACTAINGSGPAYVFMFIEAMADAAVKYGIDRKTAYVLASQTLLGSAKMQLESGIHPGILKDMVCSPAGTTIDAVAALEDGNFRSTVIKAVDAALEKAKKMSGK